MLLSSHEPDAFASLTLGEVKEKVFYKYGR